MAFYESDRNNANWSAGVVGSFATATGSNTQSAALPIGKYIVTSDTDCVFVTGADPTASVTAGSESNPLWGRTYIELEIKTASDKIAARALSAAGRFYILQPKD